MFNELGYRARSAGTSPNARRTLSVNDLRWANHIFVMEQKHKNRIKATYARAVAHQPIHVLDIPDIYQYMDTELIEQLKTSVESVLLHLSP